MSGARRTAPQAAPRPGDVVPSGVPRVFVDSSAWYALVNREDPRHLEVRDVAARWEKGLVTSAYVFDEVITLCRYRLGLDVASRVGAHLRDPSKVDLIRPLPADENAAWLLLLDRPDKVYSFTDCVSFVLMRRLGLHYALALDDDFRREGFAVLP